ncbi:glycoside hydrolase family 28 protein [Aulographum hederae CBS 113979]|uniref:Glycoside hydrolase family 28 protein n=1 Tax=Aulographum hederae CBS 113979 TaxID=1176131 RepID=A0A6G1GVG8_9PEZI|nr:glycoside hydrolase family 28 protein [Aulographum hederae CBS 113979]
MLACSYVSACLYALGAATFAHLAESATNRIWVYPVQTSIHTKSQQYSVEANNYAAPTWKYEAPYGFSHFTMANGPVDVRVFKINNKPVSGWSISPRKLKIQASIDRNCIKFQLQRAEYLILTLDNLPELILLADPVVTGGYPDVKAASTINVQSLGADPSGSHYSTAAIQTAIYHASDVNGGGTVYIPPGVYLTGNIVFKSNDWLYIEGGAVLRYTGDRSIYKTWWYKWGVPHTFWISTAYDSSNITITGHGMFDGNGKAVYTDSTHKIACTILAPIKTTNFRFEGPIIRESSFWSTTVFLSRQVLSENLKVLNRMDIGEDDGIDIVQSSNVVVRNALAASWDDPFSTKTYGPGKPVINTGQGNVFEAIPGPPQPLRNVLFERTVSWTGCFGLKVGQGSQSEQVNVTFRDAVVYDCSQAIGIHHRWGAKPYKSITFANVEVEKVSSIVDGRRTWLMLKMEDAGAGVAPFSNVVVRNVTVYDAGKTPAVVMGWNRSVIAGDVLLDSIYSKSLKRQARTLEEMGYRTR